MAGDGCCGGIVVKLLFLYTISRPAEAVNPDTVDLDEWRQM